MSGISKKLITGKIIKAMNFEMSNAQGQTLTIRNSNGDDVPIIHVETVNCAQGTVNRIVFKKSEAEQLGFLVVEE